MCSQCFHFDSNWTSLNLDSLLLPTAEASPPQDGSPQVTTEPSSLLHLALIGSWLQKQWKLHKLSETNVFFCQWCMTKGQCCERSIGAANLSFWWLGKNSPWTANIRPSLHIYACLFSPSLPVPAYCAHNPAQLMVNTIARHPSASYFKLYLCPDFEVSSSPQTTSDLKHLSIEIVTKVILLANSSKPPALHLGATRFPPSKHRHPSQGHPKQSQHRWWWGTQTHYKWRKSAWSKHGHDSNQDWNQRHDKKSVRMFVWQGSCVWGWSSFETGP